MSHRIERFSSTLRQCLADILARDMNDPLLKTAFISEVLVSPDLKKAKIFVSAAPVSGSGEEMDPETASETDRLLVRLNNAKGFIKRALAGRMYLKYIPELAFYQDEISIIK